jgi:hypothetical protein
MTANKLHVPVSDPAHATPTFLTLLSADTDHSFWVPRLAGKTDLIPNHLNSMWIELLYVAMLIGVLSISLLGQSHHVAEPAVNLGDTSFLDALGGQGFVIEQIGDAAHDGRMTD